MPSTIVHAGFALLLAAALLGEDYDRRVLAVILVALVVPEADTAAGLVMDGAHRTLLHTMVIPAGVGAVLYYDTRFRMSSLLLDRVGRRWVRIAWIVLFVHVFAHLLLDYAHLEGINLVYPFVDRFFRLEGELYLSTSEAVVQTFVDIVTEPESGATAVEAGQGGTTADTHVASPVQPDPEPEPDEPVDRRFPIAFHGWQLYLVVVGVFTVVARRLQGSPPDGEQ